MESVIPSASSVETNRRGALLGGQAGVAGEDVLQPFGQQQVGRGAERAQHVEWRRVREEAVLVGAHHVFEVEVAAARTRLLARLEGLLRNTEDGQARRHHEALLRARDADVHAPLVHAEVDGGERAHRVDEEERGVVRGIHRAAHGGHVARHAGRGFIVRHQHGLVAVGGVGLQLVGENLDRDALAPRNVDDVHLEAHPLAHVDPEQRELAEARDQHLVSGRQRVDHRGFPAARAGCGKQEHLA